MNPRIAGPVLAAAGMLLIAAAGPAQPRPRPRAVNVDRESRYPLKSTEQISKTLKFADPAAPRSVVVDNVFGAIAVRGYDGAEVVLEAKKSVYARDDARLKAALEEVTLDLNAKGGEVEIYVDGPFREHDRRGWRGSHEHRDPGYEVRYDFTLKVPARTSLDVSTVTDGDIDVTGVEGSFAVHNVNGRVRLENVAGSGEAETVNGELSVRFRRAPEAACGFKTINGDITLAFPAEPSADFRLKTWNGDVFTDFAVTSLGLRPAVREDGRREGGKFVYKSDGYYGVRTGRGGPEIRLDTMNGDILIKKIAA